MQSDNTLRAYHSLNNERIEYFSPQSTDELRLQTVKSFCSLYNLKQLFLRKVIPTTQLWPQKLKTKIQIQFYVICNLFCEKQWIKI